MKLHPATQILLWCALVATMQFLPPLRLLLVGAGVLGMAFLWSRHKLVQLLRRTRWIMVSLWLIYAFATPGEVLLALDWGPTREGVLDGCTQLMRLWVALSGLAILLGRLPRSQMMAGLYSLFWPLQWLGLSRERFAVRLALTLNYADAAMLRSVTWQEMLASLSAENAEPHTKNSHIELPVWCFSYWDVLCLTGVGIMFCWGMR